MTLGYLAAGLLVGFLAGLTGVGGGSLMTPLLVFLFRFKPVVAVGTDLLFAAITKMGGVIVHHGKHRSVDWRIVGLLAAGSLPGSIGTLFVLNAYAKVASDLNRVVSVSLGIALILVSLAQLMRGTLQRIGQEQDACAPSPMVSLRAPLTVAVGLCLGVLVTLSSVGAGALGTVAVLVLYPRLPTLKVVGTDLAFAIPLTAVAGLGHWRLGHVDFSLLGSLLLGSLPGIWIGSLLSAKVPERILRPLLAALLLVIGLKFVI
jgi:hypothetical protein